MVDGDWPSFWVFVNVICDNPKLASITILPARIRGLETGARHGERNRIEVCKLWPLEGCSQRALISLLGVPGCVVEAKYQPSLDYSPTSIKRPPSGL